MTDRLFVAVQIGEQTVEAGVAFIERHRNSTSTTFRYDDDYLANPSGYALDPGLSLFEGTQSVNGLPGAFQDCSPDRWGRNLVTKRIRAEDLNEGRTARSVGELDYLIGVSDLTRQGALRFRRERVGPYLDPDPTVPKLVELPRLLRAADVVTKDDGDDMAAIKALLDAGSGSLGGARPKASVRSDDRLFIAKFPHHNDEWDVMAWEKTALDLAARAQIDVPKSELVPVGRRRVLLVNRFDRDGLKGRLGYISAMTLVSGSDGGDYDYLDVAEYLAEHGSRVKADLWQLWRRVAFSVVIHNTDDHLRNHGFLHEASGWQLSPLFDVNPNPSMGDLRATTIAGAQTASDEVAGLMALAHDCGLAPKDSRRVLEEVLSATADWRHLALKNGIAESALPRFHDAFESRRAELMSA